MIVPSEDFEGTVFAQWLDANGYLYSHIPMNTFTRSKSALAKNKRNGVKKGFPDYVILLKQKRLMCLELKRVKGGAVSKEQKTWIAALNDCGVTAVVAKGSEEAIEKVQEEERKS